ncbi:MAG: hypothetical protein Q4E06_01675 [Lautropia sp.]|nr:hypothetical protein [Lautropia sp.]
MTFRFQHGKTVLAIALGVALAACGGESVSPDGGGSTGTDSRVGKGVFSTKAPTSVDDKGPIYEDPDTRKIHIRGDLLIQLLLSRLNERDAKGQPLISWLDADTYKYVNFYTGDEELPLLGPAALVAEDIKPDTARTGLGPYVATIDLKHGPLLYPPHIHKREGDWRTRRFDESSIQFGLSMPGMSRKGGGIQAPVTTPLVVGDTMKLRAMRHNAFISTNLYYGGLGEEYTFTAGTAKTIHPNAYYWNDGQNPYVDRGVLWHHGWWGKSNIITHVQLEVEVVDLEKRHVKACVHYEGQYYENHWLCDRWQVPDGWSSGEPLTHLSQYLVETLSLDDRTFWRWNDRKGTPQVSADSLKTTTEPVNQHGISGAVLAAMFDAWTPRAAGMRALPGFASLVKGALDPTPGTLVPFGDPPARVSVYHESRATTYADGTAHADTHSPAVGSYLYAFRSGTWKRPGEPRAASASFEQLTMAMHLNHDPVKGLTLPRWAGLHELGLDEKNGGHQIWLYQGEQLSLDRKVKVIAPNDLLLFGSIVQYWIDDELYSNPKSTAAVTLSVEKSASDARSADLCWTIYTVNGYQWSKNCTTWVIPEGWVPGQILKPQGYQLMTHARNRNWEPPFYWSTRTAR